MSPLHATGGSQAKRCMQEKTVLVVLTAAAAGMCAQVRAEKPAWYQAVIGGALLRTLDFVAARSAEYLGYLEKGQLPPARLTLTAFEEAFVLDGACYQCPAAPCHEPSYSSSSSVTTEDSRIEAALMWVHAGQTH